jgi:hypothetical protein
VKNHGKRLALNMLTGGKFLCGRVTPTPRPRPLHVSQLLTTRSSLFTDWFQRCLFPLTRCSSLPDSNHNRADGGANIKGKIGIQRSEAVIGCVLDAEETIGFSSGNMEDLSGITARICVQGGGMWEGGQKEFGEEHFAVYVLPKPPPAGMILDPTNLPDTYVLQTRTLTESVFCS